MVLTDGTEIDAGYVGVSNGSDTDEIHTVIFKNYDGAVLKTEKVKDGANATPPADPVREGYTFVGWSGSYSNVKSDVTVVAQYQKNGVESYVVTFLDYDGSVLKTQTVEKGKNAEAPADPVREGYTFTGWDKSFENVQSNLTITAQYEMVSTTDPAISVGSVNASAGDTSVKVVISVRNNPGILGMVLKLNYDSNVMTLKDASNGSALGALTLTKPGKFVNGCNFVWDGQELTEDDIQDGEVLVLTFDIQQSAAKGTYPISISYTEGDIFDGDMNDLNMILNAGAITIS